MSRPSSSRRSSRTPSTRFHPRWPPRWRTWRSSSPTGRARTSSTGGAAPSSVSTRASRSPAETRSGTAACSPIGSRSSRDPCALARPTRRTSRRRSAPRACTRSATTSGSPTPGSASSAGSDEHPALPVAFPTMRDTHGWRNWGGNQRCRPAVVESPRSDLEVAEAVRRARDAGQTVKVVGTGHSFTDIACTTGRMLSIDHLDRVVDVDLDACPITVEAGITIHRLNEELATRGLALANLGDIDCQTIAGAISTATHGTGATFGGLATFVRGLELVTADGEVLRCSGDEEPEAFHAARVGLGALGVLTRVTLQCVPAFTLHHLETRRHLDGVLDELDQLVDANEHFEFYWMPHTDACSTLANNRTEDPPRVKSAYKQWRAEVFYPNYFFGAIVALG